MGILAELLIILALIGINGIFVAAEFAILAAPRARMERLAERGSKTARLAHAVQADQRSLDGYIAAAQLGVTIASLGLGMYGEVVIAGWILPFFSGLGNFQAVTSHSVAAAAAVGLLTYLHVVLGEMAPKSLALAHPERAALVLGAPMLWTRRITLPLILLLNGAAGIILRLLRVPGVNPSAHVHSAEELEMIVEESHETGILAEEESEILVNLLHFSGLQLRKVMVPRTSVVGVPLEMPIDEVVALVVRTRHTRYPVYEGSLDNIRGMLHVKELFRELRRNPDKPDLAHALRPTVFVPEQMMVEALLLEFRRRGSQIAVVIDEYGGTSGIVSLEDVLEEIFGEVQDEFDDEQPAMLRMDGRHVKALGLVRLDELSEELDVDLQRPDADTVGGLVVAELGRLAEMGDTVQVQGITFRVTALDGLAIGSVDIELPEIDRSDDTN